MTMWGPGGREGLFFLILISAPAFFASICLRHLGSAIPGKFVGCRPPVWEFEIYDMYGGMGCRLFRP